MKLARRLTVTGSVIAVCAAAVVSMAHATETMASPPANAADSQLEFPAEDFHYPQAEAIEKKLGIVLKRGDGHITLADCTTSGSLLEVFSRTKDKICFRTTGKTGYLSLEIPSVYGAKADAAHRADLVLTADGSEQNIALDKDQWKAVGETADPEHRNHTLVEITTSS
ncbi:hypothetical protein [Streptomyces paromomycinus]|uniref:Secreted protein n=1 Tax=Streptomyces paromomycinus TaxID=92743 RepID=A0A401W4G9_STREY|nr:hypothetical protein [Streptomyces paromomycinus]GCD44224.1 hypothetical protein GKJPGBOP_03916 [Streptomyces paromomycinus]